LRRWSFPRSGAQGTLKAPHGAGGRPAVVVAVTVWMHLLCMKTPHTDLPQPAADPTCQASRPVIRIVKRGVTITSVNHWGELAPPGEKVELAPRGTAA
jgi:hypothetical protein